MTTKANYDSENTPSSSVLASFYKDNVDSFQLVEEIIVGSDEHEDEDDNRQNGNKNEHLNLQASIPPPLSSRKFETQNQQSTCNESIDCKSSETSHSNEIDTSNILINQKENSSSTSREESSAKENQTKEKIIDSSESTQPTKTKTFPSPQLFSTLSTASNIKSPQKDDILEKLKEMGAASDDDDDPQYRQILERKLRAMIEMSTLKRNRKKKKTEKIEIADNDENDRWFLREELDVSTTPSKKTASSKKPTKKEQLIKDSIQTRIRMERVLQPPSKPLDKIKLESFVQKVKQRAEIITSVNSELHQEVDEEEGSELVAPVNENSKGDTNNNNSEEEIQLEILPPSQESESTTTTRIPFTHPSLGSNSVNNQNPLVPSLSQGSSISHSQISGRDNRKKGSLSQKGETSDSYGNKLESKNVTELTKNEENTFDYDVDDDGDGDIIDGEDNSPSRHTKSDSQTTNSRDSERNVNEEDILDEQHSEDQRNGKGREFEETDEGDISVYRKLDQLREAAEVRAVFENIVHRKWRKRQRDEYRDEVAELFERSESDEGSYRNSDQEDEEQRHHRKKRKKSKKKKHLDDIEEDWTGKDVIEDIQQKGNDSETELDKNIEKKLESERKQKLKERIRKRDFLKRSLSQSSWFDEDSGSQDILKMISRSNTGYDDSNTSQGGSQTANSQKAVGGDSTILNEATQDAFQHASILREKKQQLNKLASSFKSGLGTTSLTSGFIFAVKNSSENRSSQERQSEPRQTENTANHTKKLNLRISQKSIPSFTLFEKKKK
jgi:hypothetical protein